MANKMVVTNSGLDEKSFLIWGLKSAKEIQNWDNRIEILGETLFFRNLKRNLNFGVKIGTWLSDILKMQYLVHLKLLK